MKVVIYAHYRWTVILKQNSHPQWDGREFPRYHPNWPSILRLCLGHVHFAPTIISCPNNLGLRVWTTNVTASRIHSDNSGGNFGQVLPGGSFSQCSCLSNDFRWRTFLRPRVGSYYRRKGKVVKGRKVNIPPFSKYYCIPNLEKIYRLKEGWYIEKSTPKER